MCGNGMDCVAHHNMFKVWMTQPQLGPGITVVKGVGQAKFPVCHGRVQVTVSISGLATFHDGHTAVAFSFNEGNNRNHSNEIGFITVHSCLERIVLG